MTEDGMLLVDKPATIALGYNSTTLEQCTLRQIGTASMLMAMHTQQAAFNHLGMGLMLLS